MQQNICFSLGKCSHKGACQDRSPYKQDFAENLAKGKSIYNGLLATDIGSEEIISQIIVAPLPGAYSILGGGGGKQVPPKSESYRLFTDVFLPEVWYSCWDLDGRVLIAFYGSLSVMLSYCPGIKYRQPWHQCLLLQAEGAPDYNHPC